MFSQVSWKFWHATNLKTFGLKGRKSDLMRRVERTGKNSFPLRVSLSGLSSVREDQRTESGAAVRKDYSGLKLASLKDGYLLYVQLLDKHDEKRVQSYS